MWWVNWKYRVGELAISWKSKLPSVVYGCLLLPEDGTAAPVPHHALCNTEQNKDGGYEEKSTSCEDKLEKNALILELSFLKNIVLI
jgi:hypothetical protein